MKHGYSERVFNVLVTNRTIFQNINLAENYGAFWAISKKIRVDVHSGETLEIKFDKVLSKPILNAIELLKK